ncbi:MAG: NADH-quinone oxidoreductase subunit NuoE [Candidatus Neomarinimicrobiota bacterium]|nr:NADH-quinone oxidoreductase subunit NuoE [Candidatus Neomarinimicrobiota bacterium]RKY47870.1 MAG: NADH-quinone oxidoreductase subunit NuoE [Candidatus Neomarinimicrobiota bacterium]
METVREILKKYDDAKRDSLIPILQDIQDRLGYIPREAVRDIGKHLNLPASKIYGVATFYNQFRFEPLGKYHIQICRGTACHVKGSKKVLETLERELGIKTGRTTRDGLFSLEVVACLGACGLAPVITVNGEVYANMDSEKVKKLIKSLKKEEGK